MSFLYRSAHFIHTVLYHAHKNYQHRFCHTATA